MKNSRLVKKGFGLIVVVMIIKIIGFLKQSVVAWRFGTSSDLDVYFAADGYISMFGQIILTAIPPAVVTLYLRIKEKKEKDSFISSVLVFLVILGILLVIANIALSPFLAEVLGVSFDDYQMRELSKFIVLLSPLILFACVSSVSSGVLQSKNRFIPEKLLGLFLSIGIIVCAYFLAPVRGINALLIGFMGGYLLYSVMMFILLIKNVKIRVQNPFRNDSFKKFLVVVGPIIIGVCTIDFSHLVDRIIASSLTSGSVSSLYYSQILSGDLINGVIVASIGMLLLPMLSVKIQSKTKMDVFESLRKIFCTIAPLLLLITLLYLIIGKELVSVVFQRGEFTQESTVTVTSCLIGYAVGFIFMLIKEILARYFYASENTKVPMIANIISILLNMVLSLILSSKIGVSGIAYATSISYVVASFVLLFNIRRQNAGNRLISRGMINDLLKNIMIIFASALIGVFLKETLCLNAITEMLVIIMSVSLSFIVGSFMTRSIFGDYLRTVCAKVFRRN